MLRKCPNPEQILEIVTIPTEMSRLKLWRWKAHVWKCADCREHVTQIKETWQGYFQPEPDITSSLLKVYSRLQNDETLILKGWKLGESRMRQSAFSKLLKEGWVFRGAVSLGMGAIAGVFFYSQLMGGETKPEMAKLASVNPPLAQIRVQNKNTLQVHYLRPELVQSIEFETTRESQ